MRITFPEDHQGKALSSMCMSPRKPVTSTFTNDKPSTSLNLFTDRQVLEKKTLSLKHCDLDTTPCVLDSAPLSETDKARISKNYQAARRKEVDVKCYELCTSF